METINMNEKLKLTPEELLSLEEDQKLLQLARILDSSLPPASYNPKSHGIVTDRVRCWVALGKIANVKIAINEGYDINSKNEEGETLLHAAVLNGQLELIHLLTKLGANINAKTNDGKTPKDLANYVLHQIQSSCLLDFTPPKQKFIDIVTFLDSIE